MAPSPEVEKQWAFTTKIEKELRAVLKDKEAARIETIDQLIQELRIACERTIFLDLEYACTEEVENHLWDAHSLINNKYRKLVNRLRSDEQKKQRVERRKWEKRYVDFLKTSQYFYKGFVQRLASHYDILELRKIAHRLQLSVLSADARVQVSEKTKALALHSCHTTLLRLGDLSRYRNVLRTKERSWDVALAYYSLANDLSPYAGLAFNQMAVIFTIDEDHLFVVYYLYRAMAIDDPSPMAHGNLAVQFRKITDQWKGAQRVSSNRSRSVVQTRPTVVPLVSWFVRLHAMLYKGEEFAGHDELENEVLSQLTVTLKEKSLEGVLDKLVLVNVAAEYIAGENLKKDQSEENFQIYNQFLRLNVRTMFMLLQLLQPELAGSENHHSPDVTGKSDGHENITVVARRILPALRHYSAWLVARVDIIIAQESNSSLGVHIRELWEIYASTLTLLVATFPPENLPTVEYLLEEDAATVGFKPFRDSVHCMHHLGEGGDLKPRTTDPGVARSHPNTEMLARVRELLREGMVLATNDKYPIQLSNGPTFQFLEPDLPLSSPVATNDQAPPSLTNRARFNEPRHNISWSIPTYQEHARPASEAPSESIGILADMERMVDDLTKSTAPRVANTLRASEDSRETSYGMNSLTAHDVFANETSRPMSRQNSATPKLFFGDSPFSPKPGELPNTTPDRPMTNFRLENLRLADKYPRHASATALEQTTSSIDNTKSPWGRPQAQGLAQTPSPSQADILLGRLLQQSHNDHNPQSSGFSNDSSVYAGTPLTGIPGHNGFQSRTSTPRNPGVGNSTIYGGVSAFDSDTMLASSIWDGSQPAFGANGRPFPTPPGGQGG